MKNSKLYILGALMAVALSSCSFYNPISTNVPSYEKVGEINVGVNLGTSADVVVSTNPVEHLSIIGTASSSGKLTNNTGDFNNLPDSVLYDYNRYQFELGVGYYYMLTDKIQHDFHIGYGIGSSARDQNSDYSYGTYDNYYYSAYKADVSNFFIQSSLIMEMDEKVNAYLSSKFNYISLSNYEQAYNEVYNYPYPQANFQLRDKSYWLNQFGVGLIADLGPLQLSAQGQLNFRFVNNFDFEERPLGLYIGVNFSIDEIINRNN